MYICITVAGHPVENHKGKSKGSGIEFIITGSCVHIIYHFMLEWTCQNYKHFFVGNFCRKRKLLPIFKL